MQKLNTCKQRRLGKQTVTESSQKMTKKIEGRHTQMDTLYLMESCYNQTVSKHTLHANCRAKARASAGHCCTLHQIYKLAWQASSARIKRENLKESSLASSITVHPRCTITVRHVEGDKLAASDANIERAITFTAGFMNVVDFEP